MDIKYKDISNELDKVKPLWEELNNHHLKRSTDFKDNFRKFAFEERKRRILEKQFKIIGVFDNCTLIGYCISSISDNREIGEIESLYIDNNYRGMNIGKELMTKSLQWIEENEVQNIHIYVAVGNEEALEFYNKFGFRPSTYKLKRLSK